MPELAPDEVLVAVMASGINYNTVRSAMFEPLSTFTSLRRLARGGGWAARHDRPFHVVGSDAAGVVVRAGSGARRRRVGGEVVVSPVYVDDEEPAGDPLGAGTAYHMLVAERGARMTQGDVVLVRAAAGGLGAYAVQLVGAAGSRSASSAARRRRRTHAPSADTPSSTARGSV